MKFGNIKPNKSFPDFCVPTSNSEDHCNSCIWAHTSSYRWSIMIKQLHKIHHFIPTFQYNSNKKDTYTWLKCVTTLKMSVTDMNQNLIDSSWNSPGHLWSLEIFMPNPKFSMSNALHNIFTKLWRNSTSQSKIWMINLSQGSDLETWTSKIFK